MKYFYDTEFKEDGRTVDLISIGIVAEDGREFYAVSNEFDTRRVARDWWLMENVMSSIEHEQFVAAEFDGSPLLRDIFVTDPAAMSRKQMAMEIELFFQAGPTPPDLWAWYSAYDHICLAQLWGRMLDLPYDKVPMWTNDLKTLVSLAGNPPMPKQPAGLHNALEDARMNKVRYDYLMGVLDAAKD